jgi:hypothetical protein
MLFEANKLPPMENVHNLPDNALVDMLAVYTDKYTKMINELNMECHEFYDCKLMVRYLQQEIEARRHPTDDNGPLLQP